MKNTSYGWFKLRLRKPKTWLWQLTHPRQNRNVNRWLREVDALLKQEMEKPSFKKKIDDMIVDGLCYGTSSLTGVLKDIAVMEEVKRINREIAQGFKVADDLIHKEIMGPGPEKFTGLEERLKKIKAEGKAMTITEIEEYYGKVSADWVRDKIADGTFKPPVVIIRLENPKCERQFLRFDDVVGYIDLDGWPIVKLPEHLRAFDVVRVEIEEKP